MFNHLAINTISDFNYNKNSCADPLFWYDKVGRLVLSQNTKQYNAKPYKKYSYTKYDERGRILEVGEKTDSLSANMADPCFTFIFGDSVSNYFNPKTINNNKLIQWINWGYKTRRQVTRTYYDVPNFAVPNFAQKNLRNRVAGITYKDVDDGIVGTYDFATHYTYDIHGNVNELVQDIPQLAAIGAAQQYKRIEYDYDLVSGKVNQVKYQKGQPDAFYHKYEYDADNRIVKVQTSRDNVIWDNDAKYFYYAHGPLARTELGNNQVQGIDYAYTLQGWIKGVNSETLNPSRDIGRDGDLSNPNNLNANFARDVFAYTLNYYKNDYKPVNANYSTTANSFMADKSNIDLRVDAPNLYNGNISSMVTTIMKPDSSRVMPQLTAYRYDQLNRISEMKAFDNINLNTNAWNNPGAYAGKYYNAFSYDANGNILTALAKNQAGRIIDNQTYHYQYKNERLVRNRLFAINDLADTTSGNDLKNQIAFDSTEAYINGSNNYSYDEIGNLIKDEQNEIAQILWTVSGKIKQVTRKTGSTKNNIRYDYDAMSNRVAKVIYNQQGSLVKSEYYVRDAQGNLLSTYTLKNNDTTHVTSFAQTEKHYYGSSLLCIDKQEVELVEAPINTTNFNHKLRFKQFSLSNHLGNALAIITDCKTPVDANSDGTIDYYKSDLTAANDYAPFGGLLTERTFNKGTFPNGFNGKRDESEIDGWQDYGMRVYSSWVRRPITIDPLFRKFPELSNYQFFSNSPIQNIDIDGLEGSNAGVHSLMVWSGCKNSPEAIKTFDQINFVMGVYALAVSVTVLTYGAASELGVTVSWSAMVEMGVTVGTVKATISAVCGDPAGEIAKSFISGFVGGAILAIPGGGGLFAKGLVAGVAEEFTSQAMNGEFNTVNLIESGVLDGLTNLLGGEFVKRGKKFIDRKVQEIFSKIESTAGQDEIKNNILREAKEKGITYSKKDLGSKIKERTTELKELTQKQADQLEDALELLEVTHDKIHSKNVENANNKKESE